MALINRLTRLVRADFHAVLDQIEEPEAVLAEAIREMSAHIEKGQGELSQLVGVEQQMATRLQRLKQSIADIAHELDVCFEHQRDTLSRTLLRRRLQAERSVAQIQSRREQIRSRIDDQRRSIEEQVATLESLRQKSALVSSCDTAKVTPASSYEEAHLLNVSDDDVEIAFLREQQRRAGS